MELSNESLSQYALSVSRRELPPDTIAKAMRLVYDSLGCCLGAYTSPPSKILRMLYSPSRHGTGGTATIIGSGESAATEYAALINSTMVRYLDFNDTYVHQGRACHPSDHIPALLAVAESNGKTGRELLRAATLAYEIQGAGIDAGGVWERGFDYVTWGALSCTLSAGILMDLSERELVNALGIAGSSSAALGVTRLGDVSMWKGVAHPYVNRNAIQACQMARGGMTGPNRLFDEDSGFFETVTGERISFELADETDETYRIDEANIKPFACGYYMQTAVSAATEIRQEHDLDPGTIEEVRVETFAQAHDVLAGDEKWNDDLTRETADHSLPYTIAVALFSGEVTPQQYTSEYLESEGVHEIMNAVSVEENEELTAFACEKADAIPAVVRITAGRERHESRVNYPLGHARNPMSDEQLEEKVTGLVEPYLTDRQAEALRTTCYNLVHEERITSLLESTAV